MPRAGHEEVAVGAHEVYLLPNGVLSLPRSRVIYGDTSDERLLTPVYSVLIRTDDGDILFDTGIDPDAAWNPKALEGVTRNLHSFTEEDDVRSRLRDAGTTENDIRVVIASHFHYDHIGGLRFFRNAKVYVQNNELRAARHPDMGVDCILRKQYFDHPLDFHTLMGDTEIVPGVWVLSTFGHTPGHQSLLVELPSGTMIFSGDAIHVWENAEKERPFNGFYNLQDAFESIRRLKMLAAVTKGTLVPSHDPALWETFKPAPYRYT